MLGRLSNIKKNRTRSKQRLAYIPILWMNYEEPVYKLIITHFVSDMKCHSDVKDIMTIKISHNLCRNLVMCSLVCRMSSSSVFLKLIRSWRRFFRIVLKHCLSNKISASCFTRVHKTPIKRHIWSPKPLKVPLF